MTAARIRLPQRGIGQGSLPKVALRLAVLFTILGAWQLLGDDQSRLTMPTFTRTLAALAELISTGALIDGLWTTNQALIGGYALSLAVSLPLGVLLGTSIGAERVLQPYLTILLAAPMISVVPIIQAAFGLTLGARIAVVFLFAFIYMTINTTVGVRGVDSRLREMASSFGSTRLQMLRWVILPGAVPAIMAGVRLGLGRAIIGMIIAELVLVGAGIGSLIIEYETRIQPAYVFAIVLAVVLEGVLLMEIARRIEGRLAHWRGTSAVE